MKGQQRGASGGRTPPDLATSPPPSYGGLWAGPGLLLGWYFAQMTQVDGPFYLFFCAKLC
jgi:hypothetical protein